MPINEEVLDAVAHVMRHYFADHPAAEAVEAGALAAYMRAHGACDHCTARFVREVGGATSGNVESDLADAIGRVWDSEQWQALRARQAADEGGAS
jgi:hypothetical protein